MSFNDHGALFDAIDEGNKETIDAIIQSFPDVLVMALLWACQTTNLPFVEYFLQRGAKVSTCHIQQAIEKGHFAMTKLLADFGADFLPGDVRKVLEFGNLELVKVVVLHCKQQFFGIFARACLLGFLDIAKFLLPFENKHELFNGLIAAGESGQIEIAKFIFDKMETDPGFSMEIDQITVFYTAVFYDKFEFVRFLVEEKNWSPPPLIGSASFSKNLDMIRYFIEYGNVVCVDDLLHAFTCGNLDSAKLFLDEEYIGVDDEDFKAMRHASERNYMELIFFLSDYGANTDMLTPRQKTILSFRNKRVQKKLTKAANMIGTWWIPICYDLNRECGRRMQDKILNRIESYVIGE